MSLPIWIVDAFTKEPFKGNPAAVVYLSDWLDDSEMQNIAAENNLSETAFLVKTGDDCYHIRWFSPISEIDFCGHASLASAFVYFSQLSHRKEMILYAEAVGEFKVIELTDQRIQMSFPIRAPHELEGEVPKALLLGVSKPPTTVLKNNQAYVAVYSKAEDVRSLDYDSEQLKKLAPYDLAVTAPDAGSEDIDFVSRYFWPANGNDEDPVTGSIHAGLAPYWAEKLHKSKLTALQVSKRTGILYCDVKPDRVLISGDAVLYSQGKLTGFKRNE